MCPSEKLPNIDRIQRILAAVHDAQIEITEATDVFDDEHNDVPLNGDFVGAVTRQLDFVSDMPPEETFARVIEGSDRVVLEYDDPITYDSVFEAFPQRASRTSTRPPIGSRESNILLNWYAKLALDVPEGQESAYLPCPLGNPKKVAATFELLVRNNLPHKLDLTSWPARFIIAELEKHIRSRGPRYCHGRLEVWQPWMGSLEERDEVLRKRGPPPGLSAVANSIPFLGDGGQGRLVWRSNCFGVPNPINAQQQQDDQHILKSIKKLEHDLALLRFSIANYLMHWLVDYVVRPLVRRQRMRGLRFDHLVQAVKEILGDEWFQVPFDVKGELSGWENGPALNMRRRDLLEVVRLWLSDYEIPE